MKITTEHCREVIEENVKIILQYVPEKFHDEVNSSLTTIEVFSGVIVRNKIREEAEK